jgi:hypothetical protein
VTGVQTLSNGETITLDMVRLREPLERALRSFSWGIVLLAAALATARLA